MTCPESHMFCFPSEATNPHPAPTLTPAWKPWKPLRISGDQKRKDGCSARLKVLETHLSISAINENEKNYWRVNSGLHQINPPTREPLHLTHILLLVFPKAFCPPFTSPQDAPNCPRLVYRPFWGFQLRDPAELDVACALWSKAAICTDFSQRHPQLCCKLGWCPKNIRKPTKVGIKCYLRCLVLSWYWFFYCDRKITDHTEWCPEHFVWSVMWNYV